MKRQSWRFRILSAAVLLGMTVVYIVVASLLVDPAPRESLPEMVRINEEPMSGKTVEEAVEIYPELQREFWDYLPVSTFAHHTITTVLNENVEGFEFMDGLVLWNVKVVE